MINENYMKSDQCPRAQCSWRTAVPTCLHALPAAFPLQGQRGVLPSDPSRPPNITYLLSRLLQKVQTLALTESLTRIQLPYYIEVLARFEE